MKVTLASAGFCVGFAVLMFLVAGDCRGLEQLRFAAFGIGGLAWSGLFIGLAMEIFAASITSPTPAPQVERASSREDQP